MLKTISEAHDKSTNGTITKNTPRKNDETFHEHRGRLGWSTFNKTRMWQTSTKTVFMSVFLCLQTHCCPLEMATLLETDGFMNAFVQMVPRRGWPQDVLSNNGTNLVGAVTEIRESTS